MKSKILSVLFFICAGLCIAYFGVILGYSGFGTSLCLIWLVFAVIFTAMGFFLRRSIRHPDELPQFLPTFIYTSFVMGLVGFIFIMNLVMSASRGDQDRQVDYCIVMGARVYSNGISKTLMYRLDRAYELYCEQPGVKLVLSGGQDTGDAIPEAFAMYNYLSMKGVPNSAMLVEPRKTTSSGIIKNAAVAIRIDADNRKVPKGPGDKVWEEDYEPKVGIITSDYHIFRSVKLARENGIEDPAAIPSESDDLLYVHNCVRESAAILKDFIMGNVNVDEEHMPEVPLNRKPTH